MRVACLINHFNYGPFIGEAVASVLAQTRVPDEIVIIDDGSKEPHLSAVREAARLSPKITLIEKANGGQASCFEAGVQQSTGEVVFFLDADDRWRPKYVETVLTLLGKRPDVGFVAANHAELFADGTTREQAFPSRDRGHSLILCLELGSAWVGARTSCLAIRREVLDDIFPLPSARAWRVCADEALVYGASMVGARKYLVGEPLVEYRVHGNNSWCGTKDSPERAYARRLEGRRLVETLRLRMSLPISLASMAHYEFRTIERPTREDYLGYRRMVLRSNLALRPKISVLGKLFHAYYVEGRRPAERMQSVPSVTELRAVHATPKSTP